MASCHCTSVTSGVYRLGHFSPFLVNAHFPITLHCIFGKEV
uniref:Uncharacterized protein n=1 Tax=Anguilla anguilla TaxID=7936 RepID=A0A0E9TFQ5_ANGAN